MPPRRCCCGADCIFFSDDFNREELGSNYSGLGEIIAGVLHAEDTVLNVCQDYILGAFYAHVLMKATAGDSFKIRVGDPDGTYLAQIDFAGTPGAGGTMTMRLSLDDGATWVEEWEYDWETADETLFVCYAPGTQISIGPTTRISGSGEAVWVTTCIPLDPHDNCWSGGRGNWTFVEGTYDDFVIQYHWVENQECQRCDCFCWDGLEGYCIPKVLYLTLGGTGLCFDGTVEMNQVIVQHFDVNSAPTLIDVPRKFTWATDPITCPSQPTVSFSLILTCNVDLSSEAGYPRFELELRRYGDLTNCFAFGFDLDDPDTGDTERGTEDLNSVAYSRSTSTCDPFYLEFPCLVDDNFACNETTPSCCGGYVQSGDPPTQSDPIPCIPIIITE